MKTANDTKGGYVGEIGSRLRLARVQAGMTLRQAEEATGLSKDTISRLERGLRKPQPLTTAKLAEAYGRSIEEFLESPKAPAPPPLNSGENRGSMPDTLKALLNYIEQRMGEHEKELNDENSPYFRNTETASRWTEELNTEARGLSKLLIEEARPHLRSMSAYEKGLITVELLRYIATLFEVRSQADERRAAMSDTPDQLASRRGKERKPGDHSDLQEFSRQLWNASG